jgi:hypothetical protein
MNEIDRQCRQCGCPLRAGLHQCPECGLTDRPAADAETAGGRGRTGEPARDPSTGGRMTIPLLLGGLVLIGLLIEIARAWLMP